MRTSSSLAALLLSTVVVAGCMGSNTPNRRPANSNTSADTNTVSVKEYGVGEDAVAGDITHKVVSVEQMDVIPSASTLPEWEIIAEDTPADEGFTWLHITGEVTNNSKEPQTVTTNGIYVTDAEDNQFEVSTDTTIYVDSDKSPVYIDLQPTQTVDWEGYFEVPKDDAGLMLVANDLSFLPESEVRIDLGL